MIHKYSNFFMQKLFKRLQFNERREFIYTGFRVFPIIANSQIGIRAFNSLIQQRLFKEEEELVCKLTIQYLPILLDNSDKLRYIETMIEYFEESSIRGIMDFLIINYLRLVINPRMHFIIRKLITRVRSLQAMEAIIQTTIENIDRLIDSPVGIDNLKDIIKNFPKAYTNRLIHSFKGKIFKMSLTDKSLSLLMIVLEKEPKVFTKFFIQEVVVENKVNLLLRQRNFSSLLIKVSEYINNSIDINLIIFQIQKEISLRSKNNLSLYRNSKDKNFKRLIEKPRCPQEDDLYIQKCESVIKHFTNKFNIS